MSGFLFSHFEGDFEYPTRLIKQEIGTLGEIYVRKPGRYLETTGAKLGTRNERKPVRTSLGLRAVRTMGS